MATDKEPKLAYAQAEQVHEELLRGGHAETLKQIRAEACRRHMTPLQVLMEMGDPREEEHG